MYVVHVDAIHNDAGTVHVKMFKLPPFKAFPFLGHICHPFSMLWEELQNHFGRRDFMCSLIGQGRYQCIIRHTMEVLYVTQLTT